MWLFSEKSHMLALFGFYILLYRDVEKYYMKIKKSNGELITEVGDTLTNYIPAVKAVVKEHSCMKGVVIKVALWKG